MSKEWPITQAPNPSKEGLARALADTGDAMKRAAESLDSAAFFRRPDPEKWSGAEHAVHLIKSVKAVAKGLSYPKWLVRLRFGKSTRSRSYEELVDFYHSKLSEGGRASGRYVPEVSQSPADPQAARDEILGKWQRAIAALNENLNSWPEQKLDHLQFPHPLLGLLSVREMLFFTHYHNLHHAQRIQEEG